jgi:hypothetical protein
MLVGITIISGVLLLSLLKVRGENFFLIALILFCTSGIFYWLDLESFASVSFMAGILSLLYILFLVLFYEKHMEK